MKTKVFISSSRVAATALATMLSLFTSCGGDDDSIDDILSKDTTTIEFEYSDYNQNSFWSYCLFDYAGEKHIGTDTIYAKKCNHNLRNGKHHLVWITGLDNKIINDSVCYNPTKKTLIANNRICYVSDQVRYCEKDIEVGLYLQTPMKIKCDKPVTCRLIIDVTDLQKAQGLDIDKQNVIGKITGFQLVKTVSLTDSNYELKDADFPICVQLINGPDKEIMLRFDEAQALCPSIGLNNIQLKAEIYDADGNQIATTQIPKISLRRGYITRLYGPLFSGNTSDWKVTMEQYLY